DFVHRSLQRAGHIRIGGLIESHVAVADLYEAQLACGFRRANFGEAAQAVGFQNPAFHDTKRSGTCPSHALHKSTPVYPLVVVIVQNRSEEHTSELQSR